MREAAYRIAGFATCHVDLQGPNWVVYLSSSDPTPLSAATLKDRFLAVLNDENLRYRIEARVGPTRDVLTALAFGALARDRQMAE